MKAIIMAGGEGQRLRPMTCTIPKPMVSLLNKPCIDYCVDLLKLHNITDITTTLFYLPEIIKTHMAAGERYGVRVRHSESKTPLGTAGSVKEAVLHRDTHVIISGDSITDCDLSDALNFHRRNQSKITIILKRVDVPMEYGIALMDSRKRITRFLEKPSKSEVISDLANTGMYIIEPEILDMIPNRSFDFSNDLFPMLLNNSIPIYGYEMRGYWCDIGSIEQYMKAQRDMLAGKVSFFTEAQRNGDLLIEKGAMISDDAIVRAPSYISKDAQIGPRTLIDAFSVIGSGARIHEDCSVKRSVILDSAVLRAGCEVRAAVVCKNASLNDKSAVFENSVIGENAVVGEHALVTGGASVWPGKQVDPGETLENNRVFGRHVSLNVTDSCISGHCDTELSPERALRLSAAFVNTLLKGNEIGISTDGSPQSHMLKRAAEAGAMSQGANVYAFVHFPYTVLKFAIREMGLSGGIYISRNPSDAHRAELSFFDENGLPISQKQTKKLSSVFNSGEQLPKTGEELGIVENISGTVRSYETYLSRDIDREAIKKANITVAIDASSTIYAVAAVTMLRSGAKVKRIDSQNGSRLMNETLSADATLGLYISDEHSLTVYCGENKVISHNELLTLLARYSMYKGRSDRFAFAISYPDEYARYLMDKGASILPAPDSMMMWERLAHRTGAYLGEFFDSLMASVRILEMKADGVLERLYAELPESYTREGKISCTFNEVGKALRSLSETEPEGSVTPMDGVKVENEKGWVFVKNSDSSLKVVCGSFREEYAQELSKLYMDKLTKALK